MSKIYKILLFSMACIFCTLHPTVSHAEEWKKAKKDGVEYSYRFSKKEPNSVEIVKISKAPPDLKIPSKLDGHRVYAMVYPQGYTGPYITFRKGKFPKVKLEDGKRVKALNSLRIDEGMKSMAFAPRAKQIILPHSMLLVDWGACWGDTALKKLIIQNPQMEIGDSAFSECSNLTEIIWPYGIFKGTVGSDAFSYCGFKTLKLPHMQDMMRQIKLHAFSWNKKLKKITFDKQITRVKIGDEWFTGCKKARIIVGKNVKSFSSKVNTYVNTVRLLGKKTKLTGFTKIMKAESGPYKGTYIKIDYPVAPDCKYYIQYKKFIVPKGSKALPILKKAYYGSTANVGSEELHAAEENEYFYFGNPIKKVKVVKK